MYNFLYIISEVDFILAKCASEIEMQNAVLMISDEFAELFMEIIRNDTGSVLFPHILQADFALI